MSLKFTFGEGSSDHHDHEDASSSSTTSLGMPSSTLELRAGLLPDAVVAEVFSVDGTSYSRSERALPEPKTETVAQAVRSAMARSVAELPEPVQDGVGRIVLDLPGFGAQVLESWGLTGGSDDAPGFTVDAALQARTGIATGTPISLAP